MAGKVGGMGGDRRPPKGELSPLAPFRADCAAMPTLVLVPGLACDGELWREQQPVLAARYAVCVSDVHFRHDTLPAMAAALLAKTAGPLVLAGCSMGGMVALEAVRQAPERIRAMALLGSTARPDTPELIALRTQACELFAAGRMDEVLRANVGFAFHPQGAGDTALVDRYLAMVRRAGAEQLIRQNRAVMARADSRPLLPRLTCPLLVACGEADALTPPEHAAEIAALAPRARLEVIAGAGHMLTLEQPGRVNALLLDWLAGLSV
jgi:pimeloyl-ACP methyl ester carboxylesterase